MAKPSGRKASPATKTKPRAKAGADKAEPKRGIPNEIKGIIFIALGVFLLFAFLTEMTGAVGGFLKQTFYGLLGVSGAISCAFMVLTGVSVLMDKKERNLTRLFLLLGIMVCTSVLTALFCGDTEFLPNTGFTGQIVDMFNRGTACEGGGVIGSGLCKLLVMIIGTAGTWVLAIAAELILLILITGVSVTALLKKYGGKARQFAAERKKPKEEEKPQKPEKPATEKKKTGKFFEGYFRGNEPIDAGEETPEPPAPERFVLQEDDELLTDMFPDAEASAEDDLPFTLDNMKTGTLSELPITAADGSVHQVPNPEDTTEFTPPSEAKLQDVLDPQTQKAVDAGISLDRAVDAGKRMAAEDSETEIESQIAAAEELPKRMITYRMPTTDLLDAPAPKSRSREEVKAELEEKANRLLDTLRSFKVEAKIVNITQGPSVTRFELQPGFGVKVSKITGLTDDIALSLAAPGVRIEAPIPGKSAIGIEIPNRDPAAVPIREVLESDKFKKFTSKTAFALGKDIAGNCIVADVAKFPHVLIAGQTGSGKSVCINSLILSILYKSKPDEVKMIMVDPKKVELDCYNGIPHLLIPVVNDPKHAAGALNWAVVEMENRYTLFKDTGVRNLKGYNAMMEDRGEPDSKLPEIVIIIDEFADLMIAAKAEVEDAINRLAALARAAGMYLVIATQRPTVNVITGVIKANIPSRIAFNVTSQIDSRTILDSPGAEKLLGRGDMLYNPSGAMKPMRIQGNFVSDAEIEKVLTFIKSQYEADYDANIIETIQKEQEKIVASGEASSGEDLGDASHRGAEAKDELFLQAVEMVLENGQASVAMFQRRFKIGYQRAARLIDQMEERRVIGPYEGTKPRQVLITRQEFLEMKMHEEE